MSGGGPGNSADAIDNEITLDRINVQINVIKLFNFSQGVEITHWTPGTRPGTQLHAGGMKSLNHKPNR